MLKEQEQMFQSCDDQMEQFAGIGIFSALSKVEKRKGAITYQFKWHMEQIFELVVDGKRGEISIPMVLPLVSKKSTLDAEFRDFIRSLSGPQLPQHQRLLSRGDTLRINNRGGMLSLAIKSEMGNAKQLTKKIIGAVHQVYTLFLRSGGYDDYLMEAFNIDLDTYL